jgi:hypothetical protein
MTNPIGELVWRSALSRGPVIPGVQDLLAWASYLRPQEAVLLDCATLLAGAPQPEVAHGGPIAPVEWTLEIAIRELEDVARHCRPMLSPRDRPRTTGHPDAPPNIPTSLVALPMNLDVTVRALVAMLTNPAHPNKTALIAHLEGLTEIARRLPKLDYRCYAYGDLDLLVTAIATTVLGDFALRIRDLVDGPLGSPDLFHRSARLSMVGLGPWFSNVGRVIRDSRDLFDLARIACAAAGRDGDDAVGAWIVLLSRGCSGGLLRQIIDDLADYGAMAPLSLILDHTLCRSATVIDDGLVMYLRDAALDNADHQLAARAQAAIVRLWPDRLWEQEILGTILAGGGQLREADATYRSALARDPHHSGIRMRLAALGTSAFEPFLIRQGFASPSDRVHTRLNRRGVAFDYARRKGTRVLAVHLR